MEGLSLKIGKLRQTINSICSVGQVELSEYQLKEILQQINQIFNLSSRHSFCDSFISDTLQFVNIINNVADLSPTVKSEVVSSCIVPILELITRGDVSFGFKVEILKLTNVLLENCPNSTKESLLTHSVFEKLIVKFGRQLDTVGDYEYQVGLIECLFRIIPKKFRPKYGKLLFSDALLLDQFLAIKDQDFETDCRIFLNDYNSDESQKQRVLSIPCISAFLGNRELKKPNDPGYNDFWVDFNYGSGRLTIFCEDYSAGSQDFSDDGSWETLSVWKSDVQRYKITAEEDCHYLDVELVNPIPTLYPSQTGVSGKIVSFTFDSVWRMEEAAVETFGGDKWFKKPSKPKVSLPTTSVCVRASDSPDFEMESNYDELDEEIGTCQDPSVDLDCPPKFSVPSQPTRVKVSVPCVAVVLDSSQNSVMEPVEAIAMKYVQSLQAQGIGNNTSEPEEGMCADDDLEVVSLGDEKSSPVTSKVSEPVSCVNLGLGKTVKKNHQKSAGIPVPKTPTTRGLSKVKVKTPVAVLTPNEGTKSRKTLKKKLATSKPPVKSSKSQEKHMKTVAAKENEPISFPECCPGKDDSKIRHTEQRIKISSLSRANIAQKKQPCDTKRPRKAKNNSSINTISYTAVNPEPEDNSIENVSKTSKVEKLKTRNKSKAQENEHDGNVQKTVERKSTELEATKQDFAFNSQDSLINEETCKEIYSMEQDGLSFTEECDKDVQCSKKGSDNKTSEKDCQHSSTTRVDKTNGKNKENLKIIKGKEQISNNKRSKSKTGNDLKIDKSVPDRDQGIQNDIEVDVIQSSCDLEKFDKGQGTQTSEYVTLIANDDEPVNQDFNCKVNEIVTDNKKDQERANRRRETRTSKTTILEKSDSGVLDCDTEDFTQNLKVSATFGKGNRKKKLSKFNKAQDVDKMIEQTKTGFTYSDNDNPVENSVDTPSITCTAVNSKNRKIEQSKKEINNKDNSKQVNLDVYDFNEVDQMSRSFVPRKRTNSDKADKLAKCEISVQSENDIPAQSTNNAGVLEKKSKNIGTKKDKKQNTSENEELNTGDKDTVCNQTNNSPISQTDKRSRLKKGRKAVLESDVTSTEHSSRETRSSRQRKQTTTKTCKTKTKESRVDKEIEVIQSSLDAENDGDLDTRKSFTNKDKDVLKAKPFGQPAKGKLNWNKQLLVSTPLEDFDGDVEDFSEENEEILSSIHCSDDNESKGSMVQLEKCNVTEETNNLTKKKKQRVGKAEQESLDNDKQTDQQTELTEKGKHSSKRGRSRPGRPKQKASLRDDLEDEETGSNSQLKVDSPSLSKKHPSHGNAVTNKNTKADKCDSDFACEDEPQNTDDGLVLKKDLEKTEARKRKPRKSKNIELDVEDKNHVKKIEKRKTRLNIGRNTSPETTANISVELGTTETGSNMQRKTVLKLHTEKSDTESQDDNEVEVIHSSFSPETGEVVLNNRLSIRNEDNVVSDSLSGKKQRNNHLKEDRQNKQQTVGDMDEETSGSPQDESSHSLFNTTLSQGNAVKSLSQRKFFKERSGSSTYERHDMQSACVSAAGVQRKKSCEVEYGSSKNRVYLAMSYSSTDRINLPPEGGETAGDPYDFDKECERSSKSEKSGKTRQEDKSKEKQGKCETQIHSPKTDALLKKKKSAYKESMDRYLKEKHVVASDLAENKKRSKSGRNRDKNSVLSKGLSVDMETNDTADDINDSEQDSVCLENQALCLPKHSSAKAQKCQKKRHKKEMTEKSISRLMGRLLGRKRNASTCQDSNEEEEYDHHDALCLSKGDSTCPVKIPQCEITLDEIVGIPRLQGENSHLPCFKHHEHQGNQRKRARLEIPKTTDTAYRSDFHFGRKQESAIKNHNSKSVTTKDMKKIHIKDERRRHSDQGPSKNHNSKSVTTKDTKKTHIKDERRRHSDQGPSKKVKSSFTEEIETIDSEISDDQLCRFDDVNLEEELPLENSIITRFNQFCKKMVGELDEDIPIEKTRKEASRTLDCTNRRKEIPACRNKDDKLSSINGPRTPKFVVDEEQVEICSIKTPMTLPCSDIEGSQEGSIPSEDLQIQPLQESSKVLAEHNRNRGNRSLQQTKNTDPSGIISGYSSEIRPSRSSLKRKYDSMLHCDDEDDVCGNNQNPGYDLSDTLAMCHLRPRRLFSSDFKEITGSSDDEDNLYCGSQASSDNTGSNELMGNSTSHLDSISLDTGVSGIIKAFGMDFKKQMQTKQHCLDVLSKTVLKSSQRHLRKMFTDRTERRANIMERFGKKLLAELTALGIDVRTLEDNEAKTLDFFQQQMKNINKCRLSQEKRLENLKKMQLDFVASMCHMDQYESNQQETFQNVMKKDLTRMQKKLLADAQRHELTTVRRSLHTMIG